MESKFLQPIHLYILMIISTGFMVHVLIIPSLLSVAGRDAWLSVIASSALIAITVILVSSMNKTLDGRSLFTFLNDHYPRFLVQMLALIFAFVFIVEAFISLKFSIGWTSSNYAYETPNLIILIGYILVFIYAASRGWFVLGIIALLLFPIVSSFGLLVGIGNIPNKEYSLMFPVLQEGFGPMLQGLVYTQAGFLEIFYILFIVQFTKKRISTKGLFISGAILLILLLGPLTGAISEFGYVEATNLSNPAYEQWRLLTLGRYITRLDFLSMFQWNSGALVRVVLFTIVASMLLPLRNRRISLLLIYAILFLANLLPIPIHQFRVWLTDYYFPSIFLFLSASLLVFFILIKSKKEGTKA
ncbi:endospore germination permease [Geomicrobium sp. JSM 1781026]|uniref:endospore germination permease n=1 Tax=Geomicrobium sp. JSM 1781026 TaxID=3344580 RepID=UPI0035C19236